MPRKFPSVSTIRDLEKNLSASSKGKVLAEAMMKAIASFLVEAFTPLIVGSPCKVDNNWFFSYSLPEIMHSGRSSNPFPPIDHSSQNSSAVIIPSNGYESTPSCDANHLETDKALSNHCSMSIASYTMTSFQKFSAFFALTHFVFFVH